MHMPGRAVPELSPAEWDVMKVLWRLGEGAARDIFAELSGETGWAMNTLKTLLARLVAKGALDYVQVGNSYLYRPAVTREEATRIEADSFLERVADGEAGPVIVSFLRGASLSPGEVDELRRLLDERERPQGRRKS